MRYTDSKINRHRYGSPRAIIKIYFGNPLARGSLRPR